MTESVIPGASTEARQFRVFAPPIGGMPLVAQRLTDETNAAPSVDQVKAHQDRLSSNAANRRLPSDAEIAAKASEKQRLALLSRSIEVKFRLPDQFQVQAEFLSTDSAQAMFDFIRPCLDHNPRAITLVMVTAKGRRQVSETRSNKENLTDLFGLASRALVDVLIEYSQDAQAKISGSLRPEHKALAQPITAQVANIAQIQHDTGAETSGPKRRSTGKTKAEIPKWLKLPGRK